MNLTISQQELTRYLENMVALRKEIGKLPNGYKYWGMNDYLLQHGQWYTPKPFPRKYHKGIPKHCFGNAAMLAIKHKNLKYIEGVAVGFIIPVHHAWNADADGNVIDSTWSDLGSAYYGCEFDAKAANKLLSKGSTMLDNWKDSHPLFKEAA